jgi:hypothetical protein
MIVIISSLISFAKFDLYRELFKCNISETSETNWRVCDPVKTAQELKEIREACPKNYSGLQSGGWYRYVKGCY